MQNFQFLPNSFQTYPRSDESFFHLSTVGLRYEKCIKWRKFDDLTQSSEFIPQLDRRVREKSCTLRESWSKWQQYPRIERQTKNRFRALTFLQFRPAFFGDPLVDVVDAGVCKYVANMLGTTAGVKVDQFVSWLSLAHFSLPGNLPRIIMRLSCIINRQSVFTCAGKIQKLVYRISETINHIEK